MTDQTQTHTFKPLLGIRGKIVGAVIVLLIVTGLIAQRMSDGPTGPIPGGLLRTGTLVTEPDVDWSIVLGDKGSCVQGSACPSMEPIELQPDLRIMTEPGGLLIFSAAHMHATVPNSSGETRFSIDFRTVQLDDLTVERGAPNIDSACSGTTIHDYLCGESLAQLPEPIRTQYEKLTRPALT